MQHLSAVLLAHWTQPVTDVLFSFPYFSNNKQFVNDAYEINHMWTADMKSNEEWSSQLWSQFLQLRKEAWKKFRTSTGLEPVTSRYRCDALPTELWSNWRWEQVNFGFICSRERYEGEWCIWNKSYVNCGYEIKWRMILAVMIAIFAIA